MYKPPDGGQLNLFIGKYYNKTDSQLLRAGKMKKLSYLEEKQYEKNP